MYHLDHEDLVCKFCGKECKNKNSLVQHEIRCKLNPNKNELPNTSGKNNGMYGKHAWNKGLNKDIDDRVKQSSETFKKRRSEGKYKLTGKAKTPEIEQRRKNKLSKYAKENNNFWKYRKKHLIKYKNFQFDSSYEIEVVKSLEENNIKWEKPKSFKYIDNNNKEHTYTPDFYLPEYDVYLDPKNDFLINNINPNLGYKDTDKIKWVMEQNNIKIYIIDKNSLHWENILNIIINN